MDGGSFFGSDAGALTDAGLDADAGAGHDAGSDAGATADAGAPDAGTPDAGIADAGNPAAAVDALRNLATGSACYRYRWLNRGQMPIGYAKGLALTYARAVCQPARSDLAIVRRAASADAGRDALAHYAPEYQALNLSNAVAGIETMRHVFTLLIGLGMRESSGRHCEGRDTSASNYTSDTSEAGAWQTSWNSRAFSPELVNLYNVYDTSTAGCFRSDYEQGVTCNATSWMNWGTGATGLRFQELSKGCPGFAAEYAAVMLRVAGGSTGHYGPLRRKEAELRLECDSLLQSIESLVASRPEVCSAL